MMTFVNNYSIFVSSPGRLSLLLSLAILFPYIVASTNESISDSYCNNIISGMRFDEAIQHVSIMSSIMHATDAKTLDILLKKCLQESKINAIPSIWNQLVRDYKIVPIKESNDIWEWFNHFDKYYFYKSILSKPNNTIISMRYLENSIRRLLMFKIADQQILTAMHYVQFADLFPSHQSRNVYHNVIETLLDSSDHAVLLLSGICDLLLNSAMDENARSVVNEILLNISGKMGVFKDNTDYPLHLDHFTNLQIKYVLRPASFLWKEVVRRKIGFQNELKIRVYSDSNMTQFLTEQNFTFAEVRTRKGFKIYRISDIDVLEN